MADSGSHRSGVACAVAAFLMWGLFPLYWKPLAAVPAIEVVAHRTFWGLVSVAVWITLQPAGARCVPSRRGPAPCSC